MKRTVLAIALGAVMLTSQTAQASEVLDTDTGYGRAVAASWSRGYGHVAFLAFYHGKGVATTLVRCQNGFRDAQTWDDYGPRFRYVVKVPTYVRCVERFVFTTHGSFIRIGIGGF